MNVLLFGTDEFAVASMRALDRARQTCPAKIKELAVVTPPDRPRGPGRRPTPTPLRIASRSAGLPVFDAPASTALAAWDSWARPKAASGLFDMAAVVSFGYFMPKSLLEGFSQGAVNVHPSLLPAYRGAAPIEAALRNNDPYTGVTLIGLDTRAFDVGPIYAQTRSKLPLEDTFAVVHERLGRLGGEMLAEALLDWPRVRAGARAQSAEGVSAAPKLTRDSGRISWETMSARDIWGVFRCASHRLQPHTFLEPLRPGSSARRVVIHGMLPPSDPGLAKMRMSANLPAIATPGSLYYSPRGSPGVLWVRCAGLTSDDYAPVTSLQVDTRPRAVSAGDFANGHLFAGHHVRFL